jgi:Tol biopolymer transport system component
VPTDTNGVGDIYLLNRITGVTSLVSLPSEPGTLGNGNSYWAAISTTGRYVAFCSWATNMVPGDTNEALDVFLRDRVAGTTTRVSLTDDDGQLSLRSNSPTVSADGRYIAFHTEDPAVVPGDINGLADVFLRDLRLGTTSAVSVNPAGEVAGDTSSSPQMTPDARYVAFGSWATDLVPNDTNGWYDVFVRDLRTGRTSMVSVSSSGEQGTLNSTNAGISADGRHITFDSDAPNLVPDDTNGVGDVFVRDLF